MDFDFTEEQLAVSQAAAAIFEGMAGTERVAAIEDTPNRFDDALWSELAKANLLGLAVPEEYGGSALGLTELCLLLEQQGRAVAPVPLWATLVLGALPLARFGTAEQQARWLPGVVAGDIRLSAALTEAASSARHRPTARAQPDGDGWRLHGTAFAVPQVHLATRVLVPALADGAPDGSVIVALLDPSSPGVTLERATTSTARRWHRPTSWRGPRTGPRSCRGCSTGPARGCVPSSSA
jgi:3-oxocholest-4-en-26-oyl-CoA dehydrogenase beta subunit